jgi:hypothetical protein
MDKTTEMDYERIVLQDLASTVMHATLNWDNSDTPKKIYEAVETAVTKLKLIGDMKIDATLCRHDLLLEKLGSSRGEA